MKHAWSEKKKKENNNGNIYEEALGYMTRVELFWENAAIFPV